MLSARVMEADKRKELDILTIGEVRKAMENSLESSLKEFCRLARGREVTGMKNKLKDIEERISELEKLDRNASLPGLHSILK